LIAELRRHGRLVRSIVGKLHFAEVTERHFDQERNGRLLNGHSKHAKRHEFVFNVPHNAHALPFGLVISFLAHAESFGGQPATTIHQEETVRTRVRVGGCASDRR
jgi:hypothetical protein